MEPTRIQYQILYYGPTVEPDDKVGIGAIIFSADREFRKFHVPANWEARVARIDPNADLETLRASLLEMGDCLRSPGTQKDTLSRLEDSYSNALQISASKVAILPIDESFEQFADKLFE